MTDDETDWPLRTWLLAALGAGIGFAAYLLLTGGSGWHYTDSPLRIAGASFLTVGGIVFAFVVERRRWVWALLFALVAGLVVASVAYWSGGPQEWNDAGPWRLVSAGLAIAISAPLFQVVRDEGRWRLPYADVHRYAWTNVIIWGAGWLFVGIVWLLAFLLAALFQLIGIELLHKLVGKAWFVHLLTGVAFGGAVGLLRERHRIVAALRRVATSVLAVLAPVLGAGLLIFLGALLFTGLEPLWEATKSTTPILLACVIGGLILANAVIGDSAEDEAKQPLLRYGAIALAVALLPLGLIAAVSTGLRIGQYGLTPDRLWAVVFTGIAVAYGIAYLGAVAWRRREWAGTARPANLKLAIGLCALALILSTPLLSFGAIAARDQVARLESGRITAAKFDWAALRFDFGPAGRDALARLKRSTDPRTRSEAAKALAATNRWTLAERARTVDARQGFERRVSIFPRNVALPPELIDAITRLSQCGARADTEYCVVQHAPGSDRAVLIHFYRSCADCAPAAVALRRLPSGNWGQDNDEVPAAGSAEQRRRARAAAARGEIEIRPVERKQVFLGGEPIGRAFE